jgi:hypothetical protein
LASAFVVAGALAVAVVVTPTVVRVSVTVFSSSSAAQLVSALGRPATWAMLLMCAGLILVWTGYVAHLRVGAEESLPFRIGDWLVSYDVGFVRRGFVGSPILALTTQLALPPERIVLWIQTALYTLFSLLLCLLARRKRMNVGALSVLSSADRRQSRLDSAQLRCMRSDQPPALPGDIAIGRRTRPATDLHTKRSTSHVRGHRDRRSAHGADRVSHVRRFRTAPAGPNGRVQPPSGPQRLT